MTYAERAEAHKPRTVDGIAEAAREMISSGLSDHDVAQVLRLDVQQVRRLIGECQDCA